MKYILIFLLLISSLFLKAQSDSILRSVKLGIKSGDTIYAHSIISDITYTHKGTTPTYFLAKNVAEIDSPGVKVKINAFKEVYQSTDGVYFYYYALIENSKENIEFAVKYNFNQTINSFGLIRSDHSIIIFYLKDEQDPSL